MDVPEIPEDIRHAAFAALEDWYRRTPDDVANAVGRAILAERERRDEDIANLLEAIRVRNEALERWENGKMGP